MLIIPAIDLRGGKCVRLVEGRLDRETIYSDDPTAVAKNWQEKGAPYLHLVDLDGAFTGMPQNLNTIEKIVREVDIPVELGGGIRDLPTAEQLLELGVARVILGTAAVRNPALITEACVRLGSEAVVVGIDARDGKVAIEGWGQTAEKDALILADEIRQAGVERVIFTDISRDGTLQGPNFSAIKKFALSSQMKVIASGGVSVIEDIAALKELEPLGLEGVIIGKALYTGTVTIEQALALVEGEID